MNNKIKILGNVSIALGVLTCLLCIKTLHFAMPVGFIGMLCSVLFIYLHEKQTEKTFSIRPGIIAMFLSSIPVLIVLFYSFIKNI
jgi:hypothetical protein